MYSSRVRTAGTLPYGGLCPGGGGLCPKGGLPDRDPPDRDPPLDRDISREQNHRRCKTLPFRNFVAGGKNSMDLCKSDTPSQYTLYTCRVDQQQQLQNLCLWAIYESCTREQGASITNAMNSKSRIRNFSFQLDLE